MDELRTLGQISTILNSCIIKLTVDLVLLYEWEKEQFGIYKSDIGGAHVHTFILIPTKENLSNIYKSFTGKPLFKDSVKEYTWEDCLSKMIEPESATAKDFVKYLEERRSLWVKGLAFKLIAIFKLSYIVDMVNNDYLITNGDGPYQVFLNLETKKLESEQFKEDCSSIVNGSLDKTIASIEGVEILLTYHQKLLKQALLCYAQ